MRRDKVHNEASETEAIDGVVLVEGPGGVALLLTPGAADATAARLSETAHQARAQAGSDTP
jgi:hypothetical protein